MVLKSADTSASAAIGGQVESRRALGLLSSPANGPGSTRAETARSRLVEYAQQTRFVSGKNFFQNDNEWIDSAIQKTPNAKRVRIQFGSAEYFAFSSRNPKALPWLALAQSVQFVLNNTIYEIYD
jgi:hypothetical protein